MKEVLTRLYCKVMGYFKSEEGATAVEYGVMVSLIAVVIIAAVLLLGQTLGDLFTNVKDALITTP